MHLEGRRRLTSKLRCSRQIDSGLRSAAGHRSRLVEGTGAPLSIIMKSEEACSELLYVYSIPLMARLHRHKTALRIDDSALGQYDDLGGFAWDWRSGGSRNAVDLVVVESRGPELLL
jgi:hypothetical protein